MRTHKCMHQAVKLKGAIAFWGERMESPQFLKERVWYLSRVIKATELKLKIDCPAI